MYIHMQMYLNNVLLTLSLFLSMASSSVNKDSRMLSPGLLVPQTHRTIFFERQFGSPISFAANPGNGSLA